MAEHNVRIIFTGSFYCIAVTNYDVVKKGLLDICNVPKLLLSIYTIATMGLFHFPSALVHITVSMFLFLLLPR